MYTYIKIVILALMIAVWLPQQADALPNIESFTPSVRQIIVKQATVYATPVEPLLRVATCESRLNPKALNKKDTDGLPAYGLFQFKEKTFLTYAKKAGIENPEIWSAEHQAQVAAYMFSQVKGGKNQWGCYNTLYGHK